MSESSDERTIIQHVQDENPSGVSDAVTNILHTKAIEMINSKKEAIAKTYFGTEDSEDE